jgi:hypothetical protein
MWSGNNGPSLPTSARLGFAKHLVGLGVLIAAGEKVGMDFRSISALSYSSDKAEQDKGILGTGFQTGIYDFRPSPGMSMLNDIKNYMLVDDPAERARARKHLLDSIPIPGRMAVKDVMKVADTGDLKSFLMYTPPEPKRKKLHFKSNSRPAGGTNGAFGASPFASGNGAFGKGPF